MPLILPGNVASATAAAYDVDNSCRFDGSSAYHQKTFVAGTSQRIFSISTWIKRSTLGDAGAIWSGYYDGSNYITLAFKDDDTLRFQQAAGGVTMNYVTNRVFRDPSAWMHILAIVDTTDGTAGDRQQIWINGVRETSFGTSTNFDQNDDAEIGATDKVNIVGRDGGDDDYFDGYMAEHVFIDGTAYAATNFGEFNSDSPTIWQPIDPSGLTFGNNGYYLDFEASDNLGNDANGGTDLTESGLAATDQTTDTPTNNFPTLNSLYKNAVVYSEGNLGATIAASSFESGITTFGASTSKWYCEFKTTGTASGTTRNSAGIIADTEADGMADGELGYSANSVGYSSTAVHKNSSSQSAGSWNSYALNDIISVAMDLDNGFVYFAKNGTWENSGDPTSAGSGTGGVALDITSGYTYLFGNTVYASSAFQCNFGNPPYANTSSVADANDYGAFEYAPPSGYLALCTKNLGSDGG